MNPLDNGRTFQEPFGASALDNYKATFFKAFPELEGKVVVHHAVKKYTLTHSPNAVKQSEIHSLENLRGIPHEINSKLHLSKIHKLWNEFYRAHPNPTKQDLLDYAIKIDKISMVAMD